MGFMFLMVMAVAMDRKDPEAIVLVQVLSRTYGIFFPPDLFIFRPYSLFPSYAVPLRLPPRPLSPAVSPPVNLTGTSLGS